MKYAMPTRKKRETERDALFRVRILKEQNSIPIQLLKVSFY